VTTDYEDALIRQRISEMSDAEFEQLQAETRPPKIDPKEAATAALVRRVRGANVAETTTRSAAEAKAALDHYFGKGTNA